jgi:ATP-dependent DNA helicase RecQ
MPKTKSGNRSAPEIDWSRLHREAAERFGVKQFRPGQREVIEAVLTGRDVLAVMPTGAGKSLTYQLPSLLLPKATVVVSPLISLMQDQQEKAEDADIGAATLNSTLTKTETREAVAEIGAGEHELIYVTPERLDNPEYLEVLRRAGVSLFVVDEAHCVSQWGHDFRPAYLSLRNAAQQLGRPPILALTATATPEVSEDVADFPVLAFGQRHLDPAVAPGSAFEVGVDRSVANAVNGDAFL